MLLDENEMAEIKKAKKEEQMQKKANAAMKRLGMGEQLTMVKKVEKEEEVKKEPKAKAQPKEKAPPKEKPATAKKKKKNKPVVADD